MGPVWALHVPRRWQGGWTHRVTHAATALRIVALRYVPRWSRRRGRAPRWTITPPRSSMSDSRGKTVFASGVVLKDLMNAHRRTNEPRVQVLGPPFFDDNSVRPLKPDERFCTDPDAGEVVVFHPEAALVGFTDYTCPKCGETTGKAV